MRTTPHSFFTLTKLLSLSLFVLTFFFSFGSVFGQFENGNIPGLTPDQVQQSGGIVGSGTTTPGGLTANYSAKWEMCTGGLSISNCLSDLADYVIGSIFSLINSVLNVILAGVMWLLDVVIYTTVVKFKTNFVDLNVVSFGGAYGFSDFGSAGNALFGAQKDGLIYFIWGMLRDFVNLLLLITILYHAVKTMFDGFEGKSRVFIYLLVFSIVVNFSLFFVKFAIDVSNILTLQAYTLLVEPVGFNSWDEFRKKKGGQDSKQSATIGEYLLNVSDIAPMVSPKIQKDAAIQRITDGMKRSWVFQVGLSLIYIGVIYLLFYMIGLYVMRAAAFVFAMLLAAFLAADIFFNTFATKGGSADYEFATSLKKATDKIRDDFYEALIRGPVLFLFLFLVGILANAIFNQSIATEIKNLAEGSKEFAILGSAVGQSITIILKFAIFFALTQVLFDKLSKIGYGSGGSWVGSTGKSMANFMMRNTVGRGAGALGWVGRNTIGRGFGAYADRRIQTFRDRDESLKKRAANATIPGARFMWQQLGDLNKYRQGRAENFKKGALASGGYNVNAGLAAAAKRATGTEVDFGKGFDNTADKDGKMGYEKGDAARKAKRDTREADVLEYQKLSASEQAKLDDVKVDFADGKFTEKEIDAAIQDYKKSGGTRPVTVGSGAGAKNISVADLDKYFKGKDGKPSSAEYAKFKAEDEYNTTKAKIIKDRKSKKEMEEKIELAKEDSEEGEKARKELYTKAASKSSTDARELASKWATITEFRNDAGVALKTLKEAISLADTDVDIYDDSGVKIATRKAFSVTDKAELEALRDQLEASMRDIPSGKVDSDQIKKFVANTALTDRVYDIKRKASEKLQAVYSAGSTDGALRVKDLKEAKDNLTQELNFLNQYKPPDTAADDVKRKHMRDTIRANQKLELVDGALKNAFSTAQKIEDKIGASMEKVEKLRAKPEEKH